MDFWDFTYTPKVERNEITTHQVTTSYTGTTTVVDITTEQVNVVTNWGDIARLGVILILTYSVCIVVTKLVTAWKGRS